MTTTPVTLAKPAIDAGLMTNAFAAHEKVMTDLGLTYDHLLKLGRGVHQHRYECGQSIIKVNSHRGALTDATTGYVRLRLACDVDTPVRVTTVDGVEVVAVPHAHDGVVGIEVTWRTSRRDDAGKFLAALGAVGDGDRYRVGESYVAIDTVATYPPTGGLDAVGFRYLTVQVTDVESAHQHMLSLGFAQGRPPTRLGDTAYISFVRDADGNWVELSQRASLTGPLPEVPPERHVR